MIDLKLTEEQLDELHKGASGNSCKGARKKCRVVYLKGKGYAYPEIAKVVRVDQDTITDYVRKYRDGGLPGLLAEHSRQRKGQVDAHADRLRQVFENSPPHTANQAIEVIERETGVRLKHSACRAFLRKLGMKCRRCGFAMPVRDSPSRGYWTTPVTRNVSRSLTRPRRRGSNSCICQPISPNLNLIERLWRFVKKQVLYSPHYDTFATFKESIDVCLRDLGTRFKSKIQTLMTMQFKLFSKTENCAA